MRAVGANQTIDQVNLYGGRVRRFEDLPAPTENDDLNEDWRTLAAGSVAAALGAGDRPGPIHLNVAFREPTVPVSNDGRTSSPTYDFPIDGRQSGGPWSERPDFPVPTAWFPVENKIRGLVIAGEGVYDSGRLLSAAEQLGWPVLATAQSTLRGSRIISSYHHLLVNGVPDSLRPDIVYAVGSIGPSQRVEELVSSASERIRVDRWGRHIDPQRNATHILHADPVAALETLKPLAQGESSWSETWFETDAALRAEMSLVIESEPRSTGAAISQALNHSSWETLVVGSSLPIREVDAHLLRSGHVVANRGASGIDGFVSTALGVSSAGNQTVAITGDLGLLHDANGFLVESDDDLVVVVIDNDGGGLFDGLPQARHAPFYERLFVASQHRDLGKLAAFHNLTYDEVSDVAKLAEVVDTNLAVGGVSLIRVPVSREVDLAMRQLLDEAAGSTVSLLDA
jgi:2-succinyl-5-enolpyruvyl-6-hydroxy-3-cyclohexene-1-carboxylate synthase